MGLAQALSESLRQHPDKVLSRDADSELTGSALSAAIRCAAGRLAAEPSSAVGLLLPNCAAYPAALFGAVWAGKQPVALNPMLKPAELDFILRDAGIRTLVLVEATRPAAAGLDVKALDLAQLFQPGGPVGTAEPAAVNDADTAVMLYTSGTSGRPKGVPLSHGNLLSNAGALIDRFGVTASDVFLAVLPMFHSFGLTGMMLTPLLSGAETTFLPRFTPERAVSAMTERKVTVFMAVPGMHGLLARAKSGDESVRRLRLAVSGGEALPPSIREAFGRRFGLTLLEGYGLTETSPAIALNTPTENRAGTVGRVLPGVQVRIRGEDGADRPAGDEGEIQVRGPNVMKGYHNRPEENATAFTADGWFRTGDLGVLDADGYLRISGRIKELIIRGGEKIMPREIEDVLCLHPKVAETAVIGEPDGDRGEAIAAFVVPAVQPPPAPEELRDYCRSRLADFKVPRRFVIAADLPRGATGKLLKRALKDFKPA
jgi:long-chain acyl-CoA synthetase